jgi:molybdopterin/thiamine biosynthesis adenylyltransferase
MFRERDARHAPLAARLTGLPPAEATGRLIGREVLMDWPAEIESTRAGRALVETTANLVVRFCPQVRLCPTSAFADGLASHLVTIDSSAEPGRVAKPGAILVRLGGDDGKGGADVTGSADGWVAFVSGYGEDLPRLRDADVVIGAHGAAAMVASQVFARALPLDALVAGASRRVAYSLFEYGRPTTVPPPIAVPVIDRALLAGDGAVGQACVDVLVSSGASGRLPVVDHGLVDDWTNLNRSVLAREQDLRDQTPKARLAVGRALGSPLVIEPYERSIEETVALIEAGTIPWPRIVLSALDNRPARWALQSLWPDLVLEGATGGTMVQVFRHAHADGAACLRCLHPEDDATGEYLVTMARATGLEGERIAKALAGTNDEVTAEDVDAAPPGIREVLATNVGRDICGLLTDVERYLGPGAEPIQLSIAFSSYLAGTFLAGELVKAASGLSSPLGGRYQVDPLANLLPDAPFVQDASPTCFCQERASVVEGLRRRQSRVNR